MLGNAAVGCHTSSHAGFVESMLRPPVAVARGASASGGRRARRSSSSGSRTARPRPRPSLPLGQLRLLAVARALAQQPDLLLLDEPAAGLRAGEKARLVEALRRSRKRGLTQVLVEHDMQFVGAIADRVVVLDRGRVIADGTPPEVQDRPRRDRRLPRLGHAVTPLVEVEDSSCGTGPPSPSTASR